MWRNLSELLKIHENAEKVRVRLRISCNRSKHVKVHDKASEHSRTSQNNSKDQRALRITQKPWKFLRTFLNTAERQITPRTIQQPLRTTPEGDCEHKGFQLTDKTQVAGRVKRDVSVADENVVVQVSVGGPHQCDGER